MANQREFNQQISLLVIGAILGFVPSFITVTYQGRLQRQQVLLDRRLTALREFSAALNGNGDLVAKLDELQIAVYRLRDSPDSLDRAQEFDSVGADFLLLTARYGAKMQTETTVLDAVFGLKFPAPKFVSKFRTGAGPMTRSERIRLCNEVLQLNAQMRNDLTKFISDYQDTLNTIAIRLKAS